MAWQKRNLFSSAVNMQRGGAVPWPGYLYGGLTGDPTTGGPVMPTQLFEEGDQDINMALNNMSSTTNPSLDQIKDTEMPVVEGEMAMDQGPENFEDALFMLKQDFYDEITSFVSTTKDMKEIENYLQGMNVTYSNELKKVKKAFSIDTVHPEEELLTPGFIQELQNMLTAPEMQGDEFTGMQEGSLVGMINSQADLDKYGITIPWEYWQGYDEDRKERWIESALVGQVGSGSSVGVNEGQKEMLGRINKIIAERKGLAKDAYAPPTKQGGILGFATQYNATKAAQSGAMDKALADEMDYLQYAARTGQSPTNKNTMSAYQKEYILKDKADPITTKDWVELAKGAGRKGDVDPSEEVPFMQVYLAINGKQDVLDDAFPGYLDSVRMGYKAIEGGEPVKQAMTFGDFMQEKRRANRDTFDMTTNPGFYISEFLELDIAKE